MSNDPTSAVPSPRPHAGYRVAAAALLGSVLLGTAFFFVLARSERHLGAVRAELFAAGRDLSPEACVERVLHWRAGCEAIQPLCEQSVDPFVDTCLGGQDRGAWCREVVDGVGTTAFEFQRCTAAGLRPHTAAWRPCAAAWRAVAMHCEQRRVVELL